MRLDIDSSTPKEGTFLVTDLSISPLYLSDAIEMSTVGGIEVLCEYYPSLKIINDLQDMNKEQLAELLEKSMTGDFFWKLMGGEHDNHDLPDECILSERQQGLLTEALMESIDGLSFHHLGLAASNVLAVDKLYSNTEIINKVFSRYVASNTGASIEEAMQALTTPGKYNPKYKLTPIESVTIDTEADGADDIVPELLQPRDGPIVDITSRIINAMIRLSYKDINSNNDLIRGLHYGLVADTNKTGDVYGGGISTSELYSPNGYDLHDSYVDDLYDLSTDGPLEEMTPHDMMVLSVLAPLTEECHKIMDIIIPYVRKLIGIISSGGSSPPSQDPAPPEVIELHNFLFQFVVGYKLFPESSKRFIDDLFELTSSINVEEKNFVCVKGHMVHPFDLILSSLVAELGNAHPFEKGDGTCCCQSLSTSQTPSNYFEKLQSLPVGIKTTNASVDIVDIPKTIAEIGELYEMNLKPKAPGNRPKPTNIGLSDPPLPEEIEAVCSGVKNLTGITKTREEVLRSLQETADIMTKMSMDSYQERLNQWRSTGGKVTGFGHGRWIIHGED